MATHRMPVIYLPHGGGPWPFIDLSAFMKPHEHQALAEYLTRLAVHLPQRPTALVVVSAHWEERPIAVEVARQPKTIHDFGGFPDELYALRYPAPGHPELGLRIARMLSDVGAVTRERGFDHGSWVPLLHLYPRADVPLIQVSLPRAGSPRDISSSAVVWRRCETRAS